MTTDQPLVAAPLYRAVDAFTGEIKDQAAECARLSDENAELRCRVDELADEASAAHLLVDWLNALLGELTTERDILASQRTELVEQRNTALYSLSIAVEQRNTALYERDTARAELAARM